MQMIDRVLSRRYAAALYLSAEENGETVRISEELSKAICALSDQMYSLRHPRVSLQEKKVMLSKALGKNYSKRLVRFLELLIEKKRFNLLQMMAMDFGQLYDEGRGIVHASVRTAAGLSDPEQAILSQRLGGYVGKKVILDIKKDTSLLGGVVVRLGDWVFDASLKGKLKNIGTRLGAR